MKGEICQLKSLLLARQREFEALTVRTEQLELAQTGNDHAIEMSSLHYKQEVMYLKKQLEQMQAQHDLILK